MNPSRPPKRVARACDYCRSKRLKCTGQRPCMNCQLYEAICTTSDPQTRPEGMTGANGGRKRKRGLSREQGHQHDESHESLQNRAKQRTQVLSGAPKEPIHQHEERQEPAQPFIEVEQRARTLSPWNPPIEPKAAPLVEPTVEMAPDFDQYALDLGLVLDPFWPTNTPLSPGPQLTTLEATGDLSRQSVSPYPAHLPTPRLSDVRPSSSIFQSQDPSHNINGASFLSSHSELAELPPPPSRSAHELFLRKGPSDSKFIGMGSVGSTISECLRSSVYTHGRSMESQILEHLVNGIRHVDELALSTAFKVPPLPERDFAQRGIQAYYDYLHLLYPIMDLEFLDEWSQIYDDSNYDLTPVAYCRLCLVVAAGNLVSPSNADGTTWEVAQRLQEQSWTLIDRILASPYTGSVQVILLHALFLLYCGKTGIAWTTSGMAVRIAQSLGLHLPTPSRLGLSSKDTSLRSRLWSVAYTLDAFLSLTEGRPSAITGTPNAGSSHRLSKQECPPVAPKQIAIYIHDKHLGLAVIANKVLTLLKNGESTLNTLTQIADIDAELLDWKDAMPIEFRPDQQILADDPLYGLVAMLHLKYHNLMRTIHWISLTLTSEEVGSDLSQLGARVRSSESICVTAARSVIEVLNEASSQRIAGSPGGFIVPYCMAAISVFYRQILKEPTRHSARSNLEHMRSGTLHIITLLDGIGPRRHFRALFEAMLRVAEDAVTKAPNSQVILA